MATGRILCFIDSYEWKYVLHCLVINACSGFQMKENEDLVIAKIDATANDSPSQFQVSGFPTIYWAPKDNKKNPTKYNVSNAALHLFTVANYRTWFV